MLKTFREVFAPAVRQSQAGGCNFERIEWPPCLFIETAVEFLLAVGVIFRLHSVPPFDGRECDD
jgi:hypothetical protein